MTIDVIVVWRVLLPFFYIKGAEVIRKVTELVTIILLVELYL
jgi:hypothetical protein